MDIGNARRGVRRHPFRNGFKFRRVTCWNVRSLTSVAVATVRVNSPLLAQREAAVYAMTARQARYRPGSPIQRLLVSVGMASSAFPSAFNPRPAQARAVPSLASRRHLAGCSRDTELGPDFLAPPTLSLGRGLGLSFQEGRWVRGRGGGAGEESGAGKEEKRRIQRLKEENRLLKLSVEILLDMMTMVKLKDCHDEAEAEEGGRQASERRPTGVKGVRWAPNLPDKRRA